MTSKSNIRTVFHLHPGSMHDAAIPKWACRSECILSAINRVQPVLKSILQCSGTKTNLASAAPNMVQHSAQLAMTFSAAYRCRRSLWLRDMKETIKRCIRWRWEKCLVGACSIFFLQCHSRPLTRQWQSITTKKGLKWGLIEIDGNPQWHTQMSRWYSELWIAVTRGELFLTALK